MLTAIRWWQGHRILPGLGGRGYQHNRCAHLALGETADFDRPCVGQGVGGWGGWGGSALVYGIPGRGKLRTGEIWNGEICRGENLPPRLQI